MEGKGDRGHATKRSRSNVYGSTTVWLGNTQQNEAAELSVELAKWFWDGQATLVNHKVSYEERMKQKTTEIGKNRTGNGVADIFAGAEEGGAKEEETEPERRGDEFQEEKV